VRPSVVLWILPLCLLSASARASDAPAPSAADASVVAMPVVRLQESRPSGLVAAYVAQVGLQAFDTYSTLAAVRRGGVERNPLLTGLVAHPTAFIALKSGVTVASIMAAERMWREHHRDSAIALMAISNGLMVIVAANNASALRR
jgi:uncharacterized protein DUF5658